MGKVAIVIGATGAVGKELLAVLLTDKSFDKIKIFTRRPTGVKHSKIEERLINFDEIETYENYFSGDVLFSCMGTTLKKAKTKENQYKIDYTYQYEVARLCSNNSVSRYVLVSSGSANSKSRNFYIRMKGQLEDAVRELPFEFLTIVRPSVLVAKRKEFRLGEFLGIYLGYILTLLPGLWKYRPIKTRTVARAMVNASKLVQPDVTLEYLDIFKLAK